MPILKLRGTDVFIRRQIESQNFFSGKVFMACHGLCCTGTLRKLHTQLSLNKMFCSRSLISKKSE